MHLKTILRPLAISVAPLSVSPVFAAREVHSRLPHTWFPGVIDSTQIKGNAASPQYDFCVSPPVEYEPSTEPPPGCPGYTGPVR
jgi:hypothetical protein